MTKIGIPRFIFKDIPDEYLRENFKRLNNFMQDFPLFRGDWKFFTLTFTAAVTNGKVQHGLGFRPLDVIQTSKTGAGSITFNFDKFTADSLDVTTTGACVVRCFVGAYKEESVGVGR